MQIRTLCRCSAIFCFEIFAVLATLLVLIAGVAMWRLAAEPIPMNYLRPYIENALSNPATRYNTEIDQVQLKWASFQGMPLLQVKAMDVFKGEQHIVRVESGEIAFSPWPLIYGAFNPVRITVTGPELRIIRSTEGEFRFELANSGEKPVTPKKKTKSGAVPDENFVRRILKLVSRQADSQAQSPLKALEAIEVRNAAVLVADHKAGMTWRIPDIGLAAKRHDKGVALSGQAALTPEKKAVRLQIDSLYEINTGRFHGHIEFRHFPPSLLARFLPRGSKSLRAQTLRLDGRLDFEFAQHSRLRKLKLTASLSDDPAQLALPGIYKTPVDISDLDISLALNRKKKQLAINRLALSYAGLPIEVQANGQYSYDNGTFELSAPVNFASSTLPIGGIADVWPEMARDDPAYEWFGKKLESGRLRDIDASADLKMRLGDDTSVIKADNIKAGGNFKNMHINYRPPLIPAKEVKGGFEFADNTLNITIDKGSIGDMAVKGGTVKSTKVLKDGEGRAFIDLKLAGPLQQVMAYIARKPIEAGDLLDVARDKLKGEAELDLDLQFPTLPDLPMEKLEIRIDGILRNAVLPGLINDLDVTGGPITVQGSDGKLQLEGDVKLAGRDVTFDWIRYLEGAGGDVPYLSRLEASLTSDAALRRAFDLRLEDYIAGALPLDLVITEHEQDRLHVDLEGDLTPVRLTFNALDYTKAQGAQGHINADLRLRDETLKKVESLNMKAQALRVEDAALNFAKIQGAPRIESGTIGRLVLKASDARIDISRTSGDRLMLDVTGKSLDARPFLGPDDTSGSNTRTPMIVKGDVTRMRTTEKAHITDVKLYIEMPGTGFPEQLEMDARAGGKPIYLRYKPDNATNRQKLVLEADNAGAFMRAFDIYENMRGGTLSVNAHAKTPEQQDVLEGKLTIRDFEVFDAAILAKLLNSMSLSGIRELLENDGISFTKLQSDIHYIIKDGKRLMRFRDGRTSGSALGLTFEGNVDQANETVSIEGTIVPASDVNRFVSRIPVLGQVLAGDKGDGVFAATYRIKGDAEKTEITINPLSVLAPGILRKIFFE